MSIEIGNSSIGEVYAGLDGISEIYKGSDLVWSAYSPEINYIFRNIDENGNLTLATGNLEDSSEITKIGDYGMFCSFYDCTGLTGSVSFPNLTIVGFRGMQKAFYGCTGLTGSVSFPNLKTVGNYGLTNCFYRCLRLDGEINFNELTSISADGLNCSFLSCQGITGPVYFTKLNSINARGLYQCFGYCYSLGSIYFYSLNSSSFGKSTNQFYMMLLGVSGCTVHFPSNLQSVIGSWSDVTTGFNGTNTTVLFDLPATE